MRKFTDEELTQEEVVTLMKAALMAPTSKRSNAWQFVVVDDKETLQKLSRCKEQASQFIADAALAVVVMADPMGSDVWIGGGVTVLPGVTIGSNVSIGHGAIIHGCTIEDDCLIGMGAIILNGAVIGRGSLIAAGALVSERKVIPPNSLVMGVPGKVVRELTEEEARESGLLTSVPDAVDNAYYSMVMESLRRVDLIKESTVKVAYTPLHGSGNVPVRHMLSELGLSVAVVAEQELPDGKFPTVKLPNPESADAMSKVIALGIKTGADIVLGTDPDADRLGIAIPEDEKKTSYKLLTGNQIATLLVDYLLLTYKEQGGKEIPFVAKSLVTTDIVRRITEANGGECKDVLTGFKYIAEEIDRIDRGENPGRRFLFGCEESYGFLTVSHVHDKDAVSSSVAAVEMMCYWASKGKTLIQRLDEIYAEYGYSTEVVFSAEYDGAEGKAKMASIMAGLRAKNTGDDIVGRKIATKEDLLGENTGFPKADVLIFRFESGEKLVVRPSGTEPKIKYYLFLTEGKDGRAALEKAAPEIKEEFQKELL